MNDKKKLDKLVKKAKIRQQKFYDSKKLNVKYNVLLKLVKICIKDIVKKRPKTREYNALIKTYKDEDGKVAHKTLGFIRNKPSINNIIDYVYNSNFIKENYERKTVQDFAWRRFVELVDEKKLTPEDITKKIIKKFEEIHTWEIFFPLENISLFVKSFKLGNYRLVNFNKYQEQKWKRSISLYFKESPYPENLGCYLSMLRGDFKNFLSGKVCAVIKIKKGDPRKAVSESEEEFQVFLSCIKYMSFRWYKDYREHRILIPGQNYDKIASYIGFSRTGGTAGTYRNKNPMPFEISKHIKNRMKSDGVYKLNDILKIEKNKRTPFQNSVLTAIRLYGDAVSDPDFSEAYVKLVTILEYLLVQGNRAISHNLAEGLSFLMARDYNERKEFYNYIKKLYQIRCDIVHEAKKNIDKKLYDAIHIEIYNLLLLLINIHHKFSDKKEFLEKIKEIKFGRRYTFQRKQLRIG
ncbi:MAG: hypothetical protein ABH849_02910 [Nanoarchaeota archaeon]